jgi:hypothetical protein
MRINILVATLALVAGCVPSEEYMAKTPSGRPEVIFPTRNVASVSEKIVGLCASKGLLVQKADTHQVACGGTMQGGDAAMAQFLIGNSYSTTPERLVQFTIFPYQNGTRVQAQQWIQTQMAFGQVNKAELNSGNQFNDVMRALMSIGGKPVQAPQA